MDTDLLITFRAVARQGSITAAAGALGYTQSAVSRQIAALETGTGARLFDRRARGVTLTEHGRALLPHAESLLEGLAAARRELDALDRLDAGRLRVGAFPTAAAVLVPRAMELFRARHPGVALSLVEGTTRRQAARLTAGEVDVGVVSAFPGQALDENELALAHLLDETMLVALPGSHALAGRRRVRLAELADETWVGADEGDDDRLLRPGSLRPSFSPRVDFVVREWTAKLGLVAAGLGITLVPSLAAAAMRADVVLVPLQGGDVPRRRVYAATARARTPSPAATAFVALLLSVAGGS